MISFIIIILNSFYHYQIVVEINSGIVEGKFPKRALKLVMQWYELHKEELNHDWGLIQNTVEFVKIAPLE